MTLLLRSWTGLLATLLVGCAIAGAAKVETAIETDPPLGDPPDKTIYSPAIKDAWIAVLGRPERELKLRVADALAQAYRGGMRNLDDAATALVAELKSAKNSDVRLALARALVTLEAQQAAQTLADLASRDGLDMALVVEPALARWNYQPVRKTWLARLAEPNKSPRRTLLAIEGLEVVGETKACEALQSLTTDSRAPVDLRLRAARALGVLQTAGLEDVARRLTEKGQPANLIDRLVAASLLAHHSSDDAVQLLLLMGVDPEPAVAAIALARLRDIDPALVAPLSEQIASSKDAKVRRLAAEIFRGQATEEAVNRLAALLGDPHPGVRRYAQESLIELAAIERLDTTVRTATMKVLAGDHAKALTEAALALGALDHEPAADRLVALLEHQDANVLVAAAWALRQLAVPATAEPIFAKVKSETARTIAMEQKFAASLKANPKKMIRVPDLRPVYAQQEQLIQAVGTLRYEPAVEFFKRYLPKPPLLTEKDPPPVTTLKQASLRASAIWALGRIHEEKNDPELAKVFRGRLSDLDPNNPEALAVQSMSAIAIGRMRDEASLKTLRRFAGEQSGYGEVAGACRWAIKEMTGEVLSAPPSREYQQFGWFLEPLDF